MLHLYRYTQYDLAQARNLFEEAIGIDPDLGPAYSGLAEAYYYEVVYGFAHPENDRRQRALESAQKAVALDRDDAGAHCTLGRIRYLCRDYAAAISELEIALDLNPSLALAHYGLGAAFVFSGRPQAAFPHLESAIRLSPHDPNMGSYPVRIAEAKYLIGEDDAAVRFALKALAQPSFQWSRYAILERSIGTIRPAGRGAALSRRSDPSQTEFLGHIWSHHASFRARHGGRSLLRRTSQGRCSGSWLSITPSVKSIDPQPFYPRRHGAPASD